MPADRGLGGQSLGTSSGYTVTRIASAASTPQTLVQAVAQPHADSAKGTGSVSMASFTDGLALDDAHRTALQAAAVLRQAIVSFTTGGTANLAPSQDHEATDKPSLSTGHGGHG